MLYALGARRSIRLNKILFLCFMFFLLVLIHSRTEKAVISVGSHERKICSWNRQSVLSIISRDRDTTQLELADLFQDEICNSQSLRTGSVLESSQEVIVFIDDGFEDRTHCGIGCRFMRLDMALWYAYSNQFALHSIPHGGWEYASKSKCPDRNHECYFQSLVSESIENWILDGKTKKMITTMDAKNLKANKELLSVNLWSRTSLDAFRTEHHFGHYWLKKNKLLSEKTGCWVAAQLLFYLLKPTTALQTAIEREKKRLKWNSNGSQCVAVHVRHGDRSTLNSHIKLNEYVRALRTFDPKIWKILLVTEDAGVIQDAEENFQEYNWLYTNYPRENNGNIGTAMRAGKIDPEKEAINALINLFLSSECEYFVGRSNSTWFRLMIMLAYGKYGTMPPFHNVLEDWGHGGLRKWGFFGMCTLEELQKEVFFLKKKFPNLILMNPKNVH